MTQEAPEKESDRYLDVIQNWLTMKVGDACNRLSEQVTQIKALLARVDFTGGWSGDYHCDGFFRDLWCLLGQNSRTGHLCVFEHDENGCDQ